MLSAPVCASGSVFGPVNFRDSCVVRICEPGRRLELEARADPFGTARIAIEFNPRVEHTVAILDDHLLLGPGSACGARPANSCCTCATAAYSAISPVPPSITTTCQSPRRRPDRQLPVPGGYLCEASGVVG